MCAVLEQTYNYVFDSLSDYDRGADNTNQYLMPKAVRTPNKTGKNNFTSYQYSHTLQEFIVDFPHPSSDVK